MPLNQLKGSSGECLVNHSAALSSAEAFGFFWLAKLSWLSNRKKAMGETQAGVG